MSLDFLGVAPIVVNKYLWDTMKGIQPNLSSSSKYGNTIPIFPLGDSASGKKSCWLYTGMPMVILVIEFLESFFGRVRHRTRIVKTF